MREAGNIQQGDNEIVYPKGGVKVARYSKQAYVDVAQVIHDKITPGIGKIVAQHDPTGLLFDGFQDDMVEMITAYFADMFSRDNPRFDGFRFNDAARGRK